MNSDETTQLERFEIMINRWHHGAGEGRDLLGYLQISWAQYKDFVENNVVPDSFYGDDW